MKPSVFQAYNGRLIADGSNRHFYFVIDGKAMLICNPDSFRALGPMCTLLPFPFPFPHPHGHGGIVTVVPSAVINEFPMGDQITNPALYNVNGGIYFIPQADNPSSKKHWIVNPYSFEGCGFDWNKVKNQDVTGFADGANLYYQPALTSAWMRYLDDNTKIYDITLPETHDSATRYEDMHSSLGAISKRSGACQQHTIEEQFDLGVRMFDLRVRWSNKYNNIELAHGICYINRLFPDIFEALINKLRHFPSEFVIANIVIEDDIKGKDAQKYKNKVLELLSTYRDYIYIDKTKDGKVNRRDSSLLPTLGELRGKMFLYSKPDGYHGKLEGLYDNDPWLQRYNGANLITYAPSDCMKDDTWRYHGAKADPDKFKVHAADINNSTGLMDRVYIAKEMTFTGGIPRSNAKKTNPVVQDYLRSTPGLKRLGIVTADFYTKELAWEVIKVNPAIREISKIYAVAWLEENNLTFKWKKSEFCI